MAADVTVEEVTAALKDVYDPRFPSMLSISA